MPAKLLYRSATDRKIAGVCGGIARHADVDPVLVRLGAIGLALLAPPLGLLGYVAAWIVVPSDPVPQPAVGQGAGETGPATPGVSGGRRPGDRSAWIDPRGIETRAGIAGGLIVVAVGAFFLLVNLGVLDWGILRLWRWRVVWPLALISLGAVLVIGSLSSLRGQRRHPGRL